MKIDLNLVGTASAVPDYEMLKAALLAAQASTPTARATRESRPVVSPRNALDQILAGAVMPEEVASSLDHRFASDPDTSGEAE